MWAFSTFKINVLDYPESGFYKNTLWLSYCRVLWDFDKQ